MVNFPRNHTLPVMRWLFSNSRIGSKARIAFFLAFCSSQLVAEQLMLLSADSSTVQRLSVDPDSSPMQKIPAVSDSSKVYRNIESFSKKRKFTRFIYGLVFKPVASSAFRKRAPRLKQLRYSDFEGKIIRDVNIVTLDPYGYTVKDTAVARQNSFFKTGNFLHIKTKHTTIKNIVLFRQDEPFDSLLVKESERLIRSQEYVREVASTVLPVIRTTDSVDMFIRVVDKWSFIPDGAFSATRITAGFTEKDCIGFGHEFKGAYRWNHSNGNNAFSTSYSIPNIRNSHVRATMQYNIDEASDYRKSLAIERPLFSPLARWATGLSVAQLFQKDSFADTVPGQAIQKVLFNLQDYWAGYACNISRGTTEDERATRAIFAPRYVNIRYLQKPDLTVDSLHKYSNEDFYLFGMGISTLKYVQDNYIFNFGGIEDVPVGKVYGITGGYQIRNNVGRSYLGARISFGNYTDWGYVSSTFEYGTFFNGSSSEQGVFTANANYFGNLYKIGNWRIRQFAKPEVTWGMDRLPYESLTINNENGIQGFDSSLRGIKKIVVTLQTQIYGPWNVFGFRFGPYLNCSLGSLGDAPSGFSNSRLYSQLGIGALIKNDYLVSSNFQISLAYYPSMPGQGYNVVKINSFGTTDFGFGDFVFGKPRIAAFQ